MRILLAEHDRDMLDVTTYALRREGFQVVTAADGARAVERWRVEQPDLVLLDTDLPRRDGFAVCRAIREEATTPVILMSGRTEDEQVLRGFRLGADDYVAKPFSHRQLAARIRAVLSRCATGLTVEPVDELRVHDLKLTLSSHEVTYGGLTVRLTPLEFRLLYILASNEGRVVRSERLVEYAWGHDEGDAGLLKSHMSHIRQKLGMRPDQGPYIRNVPWVGYSLSHAEPARS
jgi:DNA-binding response OmpR family regulator